MVVVNRWLVRAADHLEDRSEILFDHTRVGWVFWLVLPKYPALTRERLTNGLNGVHGDAQPPRTWSFGWEGTPNRWLLLHNGRAVAQVAWDHPPRCETEVWQDRMLAGLNWHREGDRVTPPEPAPPLARAS